MHNKLLSCTLVALAACSGGDDGASVTSDTATSTSATVSGTTATSTTAMTTTVPTTTSDTSSASTESETTTSVDGSPYFISFSTNVGKITEGESVIFTAILSDPDGFDDIAGGTLFTENGAFSYGPFVSAGQEGTYSISVSWGAINQVAPIEFENSDLDRVFRAEFFDKDGNKAIEDTTITLHCDGGGACGGTCKDLQSDGENCGACDKFCEGGCGGGACLPIYGECIASEDGFSTCAEYCQSVAAQCVDGGCEGNTFKGYGGPTDCENDELSYDFVEPCDAPQTWGAARNVVRCCCSDTK